MIYISATFFLPDCLGLVLELKSFWKSFWIIIYLASAKYINVNVKPREIITKSKRLNSKDMLPCMAALDQAAVMWAKMAVWLVSAKHPSAQARWSAAHRKQACFTRWPRVNMQRQERAHTQSTERKWGKTLPPSLSYRWGVELKGGQHELSAQVFIVSDTQSPPEHNPEPSRARDQTNQHSMDAMRNHLAFTYRKIIRARCFGPVRQEV